MTIADNVDFIGGMLFPRLFHAAIAVHLACPSLAGDKISASGVLTPMENIEIGSELRGSIVWLAEEGAVVPKGQPVVKLRESIEKLTAELRAAQVDGARSALERYKQDYQSSVTLHAKKIIDDETLRTREFNYIQAQSQLAQAIANHKLALEDVALRTVCAPTNCVVIRQLKKVGETLVVSAGVENILRVSHIDSLYFVAYPEARYIGRIKAGQKAEMQIPLYGKERIYGEVAFVDPGVDPSSGSFRVKVLVKNPEHKIPPGLQGMVTFLGGKANE